MVSEKGGVNGRKINFISYDDAYSPPKTVEQARKLVEQDNVLLIATPLGTPTNTAIWHYMNQKKVRSCSSPPGQPNGTTPNTIRGRSVGSRITRARAAFTPATSWSTSPMAKSACFIRTTISARTI